MKYYIIAGEASGDLHASNLMKSLKKKDPEAEFRFWGGDLMQAQGGTLVKHIRDLAFMGFWEVLKNLKTIMRNIKLCKDDILAYKPDCLILVDYPGFNLRIAEFAKTIDLPVMYYISPQVWAWKEGRVKKIKKVVDHMFVILPFEKDFFKKHDYEVDFVGHPLLDAISQRDHQTDDTLRAELGIGSKPVVAVLPGSRKQEITKMLATMTQMESRFPDYQFILAGAPSQPDSFYEEILGDSRMKMVSNRTYDLLSISEAALVTSGTATLETALFDVPEVVCYRSSALSYYIGRLLVKVKFISLVNLIMDRTVVTELIQNDFNPDRLELELIRILNTEHRQQLLDDYQLLKEKLGGGGASDKTADLILKYLK